MNDETTIPPEVYALYRNGLEERRLVVETGIGKLFASICDLTGDNEAGLFTIKAKDECGEEQV